MHDGDIHDDEPEPQPDTRRIDYRERWVRLEAGIRSGEEQPCSVGASANAAIGSACWTCGHTNLVHPSRHNPALRSCAICQIFPPRQGETS